MGLGRFEESGQRLRNIVASDPGFVLATVGLGHLQWTVHADPAQAIALYERALELDPDSAYVHAMLALVWLDLGNPERADEHAARAARLGEYALRTNFAQMALQLYRDAPDRALAYAERVAQTDPTEWGVFPALRLLDQRDMDAGRTAQAIRRYARLYPALNGPGGPEASRRNLEAAISLAALLQNRGDPGTARRLLEQCRGVIADMPRLGLHGYGIADVEIHALQGDDRLALAALQRALEEGWRANWRLHLEHNPNLAGLRDDPDFQRLLREVASRLSPAYTGASTPPGPAIPGRSEHLATGG